MGAAGRMTSGLLRPWGSWVAVPVPDLEPEQLHEHRSSHYARMGHTGKEQTMSVSGVFAGIDVSKAHLDVAVRPDEIEWRSSNTDAGAREVADRLKDLDLNLVVLEATGGMEVSMASALAVLGLPVVVVNPRQVRDFAKSTGQLAKRFCQNSVSGAE